MTPGSSACAATRNAPSATDITPQGESPRGSTGLANGPTAFPVYQHGRAPEHTFAWPTTFGNGHSNHAWIRLT